MPWSSLYDIYLFIETTPPTEFVTRFPDSNQYGTWNRTRRLHAPTFLARVDTTASRNAAALRTDNGNDVVINMGDLVPPNATNAPGNNDKKENKDTLFGPNIGVVGGGPEWCEKDRKDSKSVEDEDELTPHVVREWVRKSKDRNEPTTTLQALVNLKRPTIRLSPLASSEADPSVSDTHVHHQQQHGLEFEFDCDAPKCAIALHVIGVPAHFAEDHQEHSESQIKEHIKDTTDDRLFLFETIVDGGFGRKLHLSEGAVLELSKLEHATQQAALAAVATTSESTDNLRTGDHPVAKEPRDARKRLTFFRKKGGSSATPHTNINRTQAAVTAGPALAVVDAESAPRAHVEPETPAAGAAAGGNITDTDKKKRDKDEEGGVKVTIRLTALDADGKPLRTRNEQVTYLHIVRLGPAPLPTVAAEDETTKTEGENVTANAGSSESENEKEDTRPWVVKVVKREARIGPHAFHLHEIYGLTSHSAQPAHPLAPTAPTPNAAHTYPPTNDATAGAVAAQAQEDPDPTSECLLCLSSPREVVLLPCRHLVACRECAVNMVEFGAGGTLVHSESEPTPATEPASNTNASATGDNAAAGADGIPATPSAPAPAPHAPAPTTRRKRKAKGWFCPVCRQPYTSLLRITTTAPPSAKLAADGDMGPDGKRISVSSSVEPDHPLAEDNPAPANPTSTANPGMETRGTFASLSLARPSFLRGFSRSSANGQQRDVEAQTGQVNAA